MYNFSTAAKNLSDFLAQDTDSATGTLDDAIKLATTFDADLTLTDEPGFPKGWVKADGSYSLN